MSSRIVLASMLLATVQPSESRADGPKLVPKSTFVVDVGRTAARVGGLACDGDSLWISAQSFRGNDLLLKYSLKGERLELTSLGRVGNVGGGLAHRDGRLYVLDYATNMSGEGAIFRVDQNGKLSRFVDLPDRQFNTMGLAPRGESLFYAHCPAATVPATIYEVSAAGGLREVATLGKSIRGLASDGKSLWVSDKAGVHRLDQRFRIVESFAVDFAVGEITWADGALWGIEAGTKNVDRFASQR